jgi:hypothetical protein
MLEQPPEETREARYTRQTKEQFEAIGRFVQAFELMVNTVRFGLLQLTAKDPKHQSVLNIIFHHQSITAGPLMDMLRAIIAEIVLDPDYKVLKTERDATLLIISQIANEHRDLVEHRNNLLHGTWFIGWTNPADQDFSEIKVTKFKASATGFKSVPRPANIEEMRSLVSECGRVEHLLRALIMSLVMPDGALSGKPRVTNNFQLQNKKRGMSRPMLK